MQILLTRAGSRANFLAMPTHPPTQPRFFWLLLLVLLAALALRLHRLELQSLWFDEGWSAHAAMQPTLWAAANADATNPPLYYTLLFAAARGFGLSEFSLRFVSLLFGLLVIPLVYQLARRLYGERAALYAALLATVSPLLWWASQEARMYTLLALLVTLAALAWHQLARSPRRWAWLALWGAQLAILYTHNTGPVVVLWLNLMTLIAWDALRRPGAAPRPPWRVWLAGQAAVLLLWLPYFLTRFVLLGEANSAVYSPPPLNFTLLNQVWTAFWAGNWALVGAEPLLATFWPEPPYIGQAGVILILWLTLSPWGRAIDRIVIGHVVVLIVGLIAGLVILGNELHGRYLVMVTPLLLIPLAAGIARRRYALVRYGLLAFFAVNLMDVLYYTANPLYWHDDVRGMVAHYANTTDADTTVLAWSYADRYDLAYYWERFAVPARRVTLPEGADAESIRPLLPVGGPVHINVWYTQRADFRGMLPCLLEHGLRHDATVFTTYGMSDLAYPPVDPLPITTEAVDLDFTVARVTQVGQLEPFAAEQTRCIPITITLTRPTPADLRAAVIVENRLGWEIARADAVFAQPNQVLSSRLGPGDTLTAYARVQLPVGAPRGDYRVKLRIYDETTPSGYEHRDAAGAVTGRAADLGTWRVSEADWSASSRTTHLPVGVAAPVRSNLALVAAGHHPAVPIPVRAGDVVRLELLWQGQGRLPNGTLAAGDAPPDYAINPDGPALTGTANLTLDWRAVPIPPDASGPLTLRADDVVIARFAVEALPFAAEPPAFDTAVDVAIPGVGTLVGYTIEAETITPGEPLPVTLVWRAESDALAASYTVFVQLLNADGVLIAQSDALPAAGARPTTGWRAGEYIEDRHELTFNANAAPGEARLIVGLYDAVTGLRLLLADRSDAISLPGAVLVEQGD